MTKSKNKRLKTLFVPTSTPDINRESTNDTHPAFCFEFNTCKKYSVVDLERTHKVNVLNRLYELGKITWKQIQTSPRQGLGYEKIPITSLNKTLHFPREIKEMLSFRFDNGRIIGFRKGQIFYISAIDTKYECYKH